MYRVRNRGEESEEGLHGVSCGEFRGLSLVWSLRADLVQLRFSGREGGWGLEQMLCLVIREDPLTNILAELCLWEPGFGVAAGAVFSVKTLR